MANTTNYNWETPDDTDLVKDGAAAIRTLGSSVDTTTKALNPSTTLGDIEYRSATANTNTRLPIGTTGQILSVVGGVPSWVANDVGDITEVQAGTGISVASGTGPVPVITNTVATAIDAKGDLVAGTGADTFARLEVGANDTILTADSSTATGLKWASAASGGGMTLINTGGTTLSGASTTISSIPDTYNELVIYILNCKPTNDGNGISVRFNGDATANRHGAITTFSGNSGFDSTSAFFAADFTNSGTSTSLIRVVVPQYANTTTRKYIHGSGMVNYTSNTANMALFMWMGIYNQTDAISSLEFRMQSNFLSGTVYVYGVK